MKNYILFVAIIAISNHTTHANFKEKISIAKNKFVIAKNALRVPVGVACSVAPVVIFAHHTPKIVASVGPIAGLAIVGCGALYAAIISTEISALFEKL